MRVAIAIALAAFVAACQVPAANPSHDIVASFDGWEAASDTRGWASISLRNVGFHTLTARCTITVVSDVQEKSKRMPPVKLEPEWFVSGTRVSINVDGARTIDSGTVECGSRYPDGPRIPAGSGGA